MPMRCISSRPISPGPIPRFFLTRFVTHFCAPTFILLAGVSAYLHGTKLGDRRALARFLLTRGVGLILLDIIAVSPVWGLELGVIDLATLWAIGFSMIVLAGLVFLPPGGVLAVGALILLSHNALDHVHAAEFGALAPIWIMLHEPGALPFGLRGGVAYPVLPWLGIMAVGYGLGPVFLEAKAQRKRRFTVLGLAALVLFLLLRGTNFYGDPRPWSAQNDGVMTALLMLNVTKYPPSLLYALVTRASCKQIAKLARGLAGADPGLDPSAGGGRKSEFSGKTEHVVGGQTGGLEHRI